MACTSARGSPFFSGGIGAHEAHRRPRYAESRLELGAHRHPLDEAAERRDEKRITLVTAVIAHLVTEETT